AGSRCLASAPIGELRARALEPAVRPMTEDDAPVVAALYGRAAAESNGFLERSPYMWRRIREPRNKPKPRGYVIEGDREPEGYFYAFQKPGPGTMQLDLKLTDLVATTPRACSRALGFFGRHWTLGHRLTFASGPAEAMHLAFPEVSMKLEL